MTNERILGYLNSLTEDELTALIILPLYKKRFAKQYRNVEYSGKDKREDDGVDIAYFEVTPDTKVKEYSGVQIKLGDINTGKGANGIAAITIQAQQAFEKRVCNTTDKQEYRIQAYTILTTGSIVPKARMAIVDQFKHNRIKFVTGTDLCEWIRESFSEELETLDPQADDEEAEEDDLEPIEAIMEYLEKAAHNQLLSIRGTYAVLSAAQRDIFTALLELGPSKTFKIAKHLGRSAGGLEADLDTLVIEDVIGTDSEGYNITDRDWSDLHNVATDRMLALGYAGDISDEELISAVFER